MSGGTKIWSSSWPRGETATPAVPLHIHTHLSGVLSPFSSFLTAMLSHYQIHALHLDPSSLVLLSAFMFLCEAFVDVTPSVALLRHFFSLELVSEEQCSGCASLEAADASVLGPSPLSSSPKQRGSGNSGCGSKLPRPEPCSSPCRPPQRQTGGGCARSLMNPGSRQS
ncbi:hypothetical protein D1007_19752 [Hordeum vulgare]|nr:hypothetical protein D1007_19752 [Hordeum vulgare]